MKTADIHINIVESYFGLLKNFSTDSKRVLIDKLTQSIKTKNLDKKDSLKLLYGALDTTQTADELIQEIRDARTFTRQRESF